MKPELRQRIQKRLGRVAGQVSGLQRMLDENRPCADVLTQVAALRSALDAVGVELITNHLEHCVAGCQIGPAAPHAHKRSRQALMDEMRLTLSRFLK